MSVLLSFVRSSTYSSRPKIDNGGRFFDLQGRRSKIVDKRVLRSSASKTKYGRGFSIFGADKSKNAPYLRSSKPEDRKPSNLQAPGFEFERSSNNPFTSTSRPSNLKEEPLSIFDLRFQRTKNPLHRRSSKLEERRTPYLSPS